MRKERVEDIKRLRELTGLGLYHCKTALEEAKGNLDRAVEALREKGMYRAGATLLRSTQAGRIVSYIHHDHSVGVLMEVNCESDFVANCEDFEQFVNDAVLQAVGGAPKYLSPSDIPEAAVQNEEFFQQKVLERSSIPEERKAGALKGRMKKWVSEQCLLTQPFVKNPKTTLSQQMLELSGRVGENIQICRFTRYCIGETNGQ